MAGLVEHDHEDDADDERERVLARRADDREERQPREHGDEDGRRASAVDVDRCFFQRILHAAFPTRSTTSTSPLAREPVSFENVCDVPNVPGVAAAHHVADHLAVDVRRS